MISASASVGPLFAHAAGPATFGNTVVGPYTDRTPIGDKDSVMYQAPENWNHDFNYPCISRQAVH
jgi:hypothetical protein